MMMVGGRRIQEEIQVGGWSCRELEESTLLNRGGGGEGSSMTYVRGLVLLCRGPEFPNR